jgi:hypothetical protein
LQLAVTKIKLYKKWYERDRNAHSPEEKGKMQKIREIIKVFLHQSGKPVLWILVCLYQALRIPISRRFAVLASCVFYFQLCLAGIMVM